MTGEEIQNNTNSDYLLFKRPTVFAPVSWLSIGPAIVKALNGDASDFATQVGEPPTDPAYGERAIECLEFPVQARNFAELMGRTRIARIIAPYLGGANQTGRLISKCLGWPRPRRNPRHFLNVEGAPPTRSSTRRTTPPPHTCGRSACRPRSRAACSSPGTATATPLTSAPPCAQAAIDRYLIRRVLPRPGSVCHD